MGVLEAVGSVVGMQLVGFLRWVRWWLLGGVPWYYIEENAASRLGA